MSRPYADPIPLAVSISIVCLGAAFALVVIAASGCHPATPPRSTKWEPVRPAPLPGEVYGEPDAAPLQPEQNSMASGDWF